MDTRKVVIWANCQGDIVKHFLMKYFNDVSLYVNYEIMKNELDLPEELMLADVFIYQNYQNYTDTIYGIDKILDGMSCVKICIPFLQSDIYFPYDNSQYRLHELSVCEEKPFGSFWYGINKINKIIDNIVVNAEIERRVKISCSTVVLLDGMRKNIFNEENNDSVEINKEKCLNIGRLLKDYDNVTDGMNVDGMNVDLIKNIQDSLVENDVNVDMLMGCISDEKIKEVFERNLEFMRNKILMSSVPMLYDFILDNYKTQRLFHNRNHPTGVLLKKLCDETLKCLNIEHEFTDDDELFLEHCIKDWVSPIFSYVKEYHNLEFDTDVCYSKYHDNVKDIRSYISMYICEYGRLAVDELDKKIIDNVDDTVEKFVDNELIDIACFS